MPPGNFFAYADPGLSYLTLSFLPQSVWLLSFPSMEGALVWLGLVKFGFHWFIGPIRSLITRRNITNFILKDLFGLYCVHLCFYETLSPILFHLNLIGSNCRTIQDEVETLCITPFCVNCLASSKLLVFQVSAKFNFVLIVE